MVFPSGVSFQEGGDCLEVGPFGAFWVRPCCFRSEVLSGVFCVVSSFFLVMFKFKMHKDCCFSSVVLDFLGFAEDGAFMGKPHVVRFLSPCF